MLRVTKLRLALALAALVMPVLLAAQMIAQDDPNDTPLGDVARSLRKKAPTSEAVDKVIDDDNLSNVMEQAESRHEMGSPLSFLMSGVSRGLRASAPGVTCSLSFNVKAKSLLSSQYAQMDLPARDVAKLEGPATIEGDALTVSVFNATDWHVSEVAVAFTVVKKAEYKEDFVDDGGADSDIAKPVPLPGSPVAESEARVEKNPDVTVIYRMRAAAPPLATTVFSARLNVGLMPDQEWHWAIVEAKGYPPPSYVGDAQMADDQSHVQSDEQRDALVPVPSTMSPAPAEPQTSPADPRPRNLH